MAIIEALAPSPARPIPAWIAVFPITTREQESVPSLKLRRDMHEHFTPILMALGW